MTDEVQRLAREVEIAEEEYYKAHNVFWVASAKLFQLKKDHLEATVRASGWHYGAGVIGKLKPFDELPKNLRSVHIEKSPMVYGVYVGVRHGSRGNPRPSARRPP
jgi:hypothetical protein